MKPYIIVLTVLLESIRIGSSQGTFQDLNFEEATLVPSGLGGYSAASAFPGWQLYIGENPDQSVVLNGASAGGAEISIVNNNPIQGSYSAALFGGALPPNLEPVSISQAGTVPAGTEAIEFDGNVYGAPFVVTLGGENIDMVPLQQGVNYTLWGGNIPAAMAGQTETLTITEPPPTGTPPSEFQLDDIMFSPITVTPEPDPFILTGIGGVLFALYRRFALKRR
jgi:hypothetical protein